jgi:hypothetical protein
MNFFRSTVVESRAKIEDADSSVCYDYITYLYYSRLGVGFFVVPSALKAVANVCKVSAWA